MKKKAYLLFFICLLSFTLVACGSKNTESKIYETETGQKIEVTLDISDGHKLPDEEPLYITRDDVELSKIVFISADKMPEIKEMLKTSPKSKLIEEGKKDGAEYIIWQDEFKEDSYDYVYFQLIKGTDTGAFVFNVVSKESALDCANRLSFKAK